MALLSVLVIPLVVRLNEVPVIVPLFIVAVVIVTALIVPAVILLADKLTMSASVIDADWI